MKITKEGIIQFIISALIGAIFWTAIFAPYMIFVVELPWSKVPSWVAMQFIIVPPFAPIAIWLNKKVLEYWKMRWKIED